MAKHYPPPPLAPMPRQTPAAQAKNAYRGVPPPAPAPLNRAGTPVQAKIGSTVRGAIPPPPLVPLRGSPQAAQPGSGRGVPAPPLASRPNAGVAVQGKTAPTRGSGHGTVPPPPFAPMRGHAPAAQAKPASRGVPPPPLAPIRGTGTPAQAKAVAGNAVPPPPLAPFRGAAPTARPPAPNAGGAAIQRQLREAQVVWMVTHLVRERGDTLFGEDWQTGEVPGGEMTRGQRLLVEDDDVFMSRRGANQEREQRRLEDTTGQLEHRWLGVRAVYREEKPIPCGQGVYIRAETIALAGKVGRKIKVDVKENTELVWFKDFGELNEAWQTANRKRRRSILQVGSQELVDKYNESNEQDFNAIELTSAWNWDQYDEGEDVSGNMSIPKKRTPTGVTKKQWTLRAFYEGDPTPIAYLILELRDDDDDTGRYLYVRWLIGHPEKGGGGGEVLRKAIEIFDEMPKIDGQEKRMIVESAYSAVKWYEKMGFGVTTATTVVKGIGYSDATLQYPPPDL